MTQPSVVITELDGALGVLPPSAGKLFAIVGVASAGPQNVPSTFAKVKDVVANFEAGPAVEAAAHYIERYGRPVVIVRTGQTVAGSYPAADAVVFDGDGTSVVTVDDQNTEPNDDYEVYFEVGAGGTIGVAGIRLRWSLDGGRTMSPLTDLGVASEFEIPGSGGVTVLFAAGTLVAGDSWSFVTRAPCWNAAELTTALTALRNTALAWELVHVVGPVDGDAFDAIELAIAGMAQAGKYQAWVGNTRMPNVGETEAQYLTAMSTALSAKATKYGSLYSGAQKLTSSVSGRKYRRPVSFVTAAREASVSEEINIADVNLGPLVGASIRDVNGNPDEHDESVNPGLDDARFAVLRTWDGIAGVYVNRPRLFSPEGSDFQLMPHRRVLNLAHGALRLYFIRRLNKPILVDKATGFILEEEALEIEAGALAVMRATLMAKPKASGVLFTLSRTDNLLSTKTLTGQARVIPLAYPEFINLDLGFFNPALQVQAV